MNAAPARASRLSAVKDPMRASMTLTGVPARRRRRSNGIEASDRGRVRARSIFSADFLSFRNPPLSSSTSMPEHEHDDGRCGNHAAARGGR
jgi:hypothetical protein